MKKLTLLFLVPITLIFQSCLEEDNTLPYSLKIKFIHTVGGLELTKNSIIYTNEAGNEFSVENLQYVISDVKIIRAPGDTVEILGYHFVDINDGLTLDYDPGTQLLEGDYAGLMFIMGFKEEDNGSGIYPDLNLLNWNWPEMLGGGYHFMKLEGKYIDDQQAETGFATHLGTAREVTNEGSVFHVNHVQVLSNAGFSISGPTELLINMEILNWYNTPNIWDFNTWDQGIMMIYEAQTALSENGQDVFSIASVTVE